MKRVLISEINNKNDSYIVNVSQVEYENLILFKQYLNKKGEENEVLNLKKYNDYIKLLLEKNKYSRIKVDLLLEIDSII